MQSHIAVFHDLADAGSTGALQIWAYFMLPAQFAFDWCSINSIRA
jgi:hypothetical protein